MTDTAQHTLSHVVRPSQPSEMPHMMPETLRPAERHTTAHSDFASTDRAALLARFWTQRPRRLACTDCGDVVTLRGPLKGDAEEFRCMACIGREAGRKYGRRVRAEARAQREGRAA